MSDAEVKTLIIDEQEVSARAGQTILEVARENDINIPTLCHLEGLSDVGACRLCLVEIKGSNKLLPACVATVFEGMEVSTNTERLQKHRRTILEMLFAERNHICSVCVSNGHCELQALGQEQGLTHVRLPYRNPELKWTPRTSGSPSTTTAASCARAACGSARRSKARMCGM
jgi:bidirectional [NiFe] hydrogenase diaphorase subunit